jgi:ATP-dependent helicase HrpA
MIEAAGDRRRARFSIRIDEARGEVVGSERVALYGLTSSRGDVSYGPVDPVTARIVFIREALSAVATRGKFRAQPSARRDRGA